MSLGGPQDVRRTAIASGAGGARRSVVLFGALVLLATTTVLALYALSERQCGMSASRLTLKLGKELTESNLTHAAGMVVKQQAAEEVHQDTLTRESGVHQENSAGNVSLKLPHDTDFGETQCLETCCWRYEEVEWHYAGEKGQRPKLDDRLSPGETKTLADVVLHGRYPIPDWMGQPPFVELHDDLLPCLQPGTVIFIEGDTKGRFFEQFHPRIKHPYILISGDGDDSSPGEYRKFIDDPKLMGWWGFNCDLPDIHKLPKFHCYPLGLNQWWDTRDAMQQTFQEGVAPLHWEVDLDAVAAAAGAPKLFLANYAIQSNSAARIAAHNHFCNGRLANFSSCASDNDQDVQAYFRRVRQHMFNVAPEGAGLDSYRIWETMYLGRYPIVLNSTIDESFAGLPVWVVERWEEVTVEAARAVFQVFSRKHWEWGKLYKGWWQRRVYDQRPTKQKNVRIVYTRPSKQR